MRAAIAAALLVGLAAPAWARSEKVEPYAPADVFATAVRFLRVDAGLTIVEKDADAGYVLFELAEDGHRFRGALELIRTEQDGRAAVRLVLRIDDRPAWEEQVLLDRLDRKIRDERAGAKDRPAGRGSGSGSGS